MSHDPANPGGQLRRPRRRVFTLTNILIVWLIGQIFEYRRALSSMADSNESALRSAARNNTLTIPYDSPSFIGPWGDSWIFWIVVGIVVAFLFVRWVLRKVRQGSSN